MNWSMLICVYDCYVYYRTWQQKLSDTETRKKEELEQLKVSSLTQDCLTTLYQMKKLS